MSSITWMGATYSSVSQVTLPKTGGGVATFTEGGGGGGNEFVITYAWNDNDEIYEPDCTFAEVQSAYNDGKTLIGIGQGIAVTLYYNDNGEWSDLYTIIIYNNDDEGIMYQDGYSWSGYSGYSQEEHNPLIYPNFDSPTKTYTPTTSTQTDTITYDPNDGYNGIQQVDVTINAVPLADISVENGNDDSFYTENGQRKYKVIPRLFVEDAGWVSADTTGTPKVYTAIASGTTVTPSTSSQTVGGAKQVLEGAITVSAMPSGTVTAPSTITGTSATVSTGTNTLTLSKTVSNTPNVTTPGYVSSGTAGNSNVSLTANVTTKGATTYHPSSTDQTVTSGTYTTGTQTFKAVTTSNLTADNIKSGVVVKIGDSTDDDCVASVTGTYTGGGGGSSYTLLASTQLAVNTTSTSAGSAGTINIGSAGYTKDKIIWVHIRDHAGKRNGYFYGSDSFYVNSYKANNSTTSFSACAVEYIRVDSNGNYTTATGSYGVYGYSISSSGTLTIRRRYNSTNTLTINGTFDISVYAMDMPTGLKVFD